MTVPANATRIPFQPRKQTLTARVTGAQLGFQPTHVWNPSPSPKHRITPYPVPQTLLTGMRSTAETGAKYSPPPFAVVVENGQHQALVVVAARAGSHLWNDVTFETTDRGVKVDIDLEGHSDPATVAARAATWIIPGEPGESRHQLLRRGLIALYPQANRPREIPDWWLQPIYCGWGDQVTIAQWLEGSGREMRSVAYCTQGLYERWVRRLDEAQMPIGTITIDDGWSPSGVWQPDTTKWPDLRGFIDRQHAAGRKVLLWIGLWRWEQLDPKYCVKLDGQPITADPTNPRYLAMVTEWVRHLIGPDGLNADGFKIDQLAYTPSHRNCRWSRHSNEVFQEPDAHKKPITLHGKGWGTELLYKLQKTVYDAAKSVKPDALITSSTVHPYFHDTLDMVRIHDMGHVADDIFAAMKARVDLATAALPGIPIDTDDWVHTNYQTWLDYTSGSHVLGVPCLFYAERFMLNWGKEPATKLIPQGDLKKIAKAWRKAGLHGAAQTIP